MSEKTTLADLNAAVPAESDAKRQKMDNGTFQKTTLKEFEAVFPKLEADILEHAQKCNLPQKEVEWFKAVGLSLDLPPIRLAIGLAAFLGAS